MGAHRFRRRVADGCARAVVAWSCLLFGCSAAHAPCPEAAGPFTETVTVLRAGTLGHAIEVRVCVDRAPPRTPALVLQGTFSARADAGGPPTAQLTVFATLPAALCRIGEPLDVAVTTRRSPPAVGEPASVITTGRLRIDETREAPGGPSIRGNLTLNRDGFDLSMDFAAPPCRTH